MAFIAPQVSRRRPTLRDGKWGFLEELFQGLAGGGMSLLERRDRLAREAREDEQVKRGLDLEERRLDRELETEARLAALDRRNAEAAELAAMQNYQTSQDAAFEPFRLEGGADDVREAIENIYGGSGLGSLEYTPSALPEELGGRLPIADQVSWGGMDEDPGDWLAALVAQDPKLQEMIAGQSRPDSRHRDGWSRTLSPEDEEANLAWSRVKEPRTLERTAELVERLGGPLVVRDSPEEFLERIGRQEEEQSHVPGLSIHGEFAGPIAPDVAAMPSTAEQLRMVQDTQNEAFNRALGAEIDKIEARQIPGMSDHYQAMARQVNLCIENPTHPSCPKGRGGEQSGIDPLMQIVCATNPDFPGCGDPVGEGTSGIDDITDHETSFTISAYPTKDPRVFLTLEGEPITAVSAALPEYRRLREQLAEVGTEAKIKREALSKWPQEEGSPASEEQRVQLMREAAEAERVEAQVTTSLAELMVFYKVNQEMLDFPERAYWRLPDGE